jgi:hypothetical protein
VSSFENKHLLLNLPRVDAENSFINDLPSVSLLNSKSDGNFAEAFKLYADERCTQQLFDQEKKLLDSVEKRELEYSYGNIISYISSVENNTAHYSYCGYLPVIKRKTIDCYDQVPIFHNKNAKFMNRTTHVISETALQIPCESQDETTIKKDEL